jgi:ribonucleoside-diphosphate reductase beta chain
MDNVTDEMFLRVLRMRLDEGDEKFARTVQKVSEERIQRNGFVESHHLVVTTTKKRRSEILYSLEEIESGDVDMTDSKRYVLYPLNPRYAHVFKECYTDPESMLWTIDHIALQDDVTHWQTRLTGDDRAYLVSVLAFFAASDGIVTENLATRFLNEIRPVEIRMAYSLQVYTETIHSRVYSELINTFLRTNEERDRAFAALDHYPAIRRKAQWARRWIDDKRNDDTAFAERLIAFVAVEGIFFSSSFAAIFWLKERGVCPGLAQANEYISREEGVHARLGSYVYRLLEPWLKLPTERVLEILREAVECESQFVEESMPKPLLGTNATAMKQYVRFVAEYVARMLLDDNELNVEGSAVAPPPSSSTKSGQRVYLFSDSNPFDFMHMISAERKTNFFEHRVTEYSNGNAVLRASMPEDGKKGFVTASSSSDTSLVTDADF